MADIKDKGLRYNAGKPRLELVPMEAMNAIARCFTYGANKYAPNNWRKGMEWTTVVGCLLRHIEKWNEGEDFDEESGLNHVDHIITNAAILAEYVVHQQQYDDRYKRPKKVEE